MKFEGENVKVGVVTFGGMVQIKAQPKNIDVPANLYYDFKGMVNFSSKIK